MSPTYVHEITTPEGGEGLDGLFHARKERLFGILNGIDYDVYDPGNDVLIAHHFNTLNMAEGKLANKEQLQKDYGLPVERDTMLIGMVSRLTDQKGLDLIAYIMDEMMAKERMQFIVVGTGEEKYENMLRYFEQKYPGKVKADIGYSEERAHRVYAGCDAFLMPSLFEPCGLSQMIAMRYGTLPIVRETGGLKDTIQAYNEYEQLGTGFSFANYNAHEMYHTIQYAMQVYYEHRKEWNNMAVRAMEQDFSWNSSAREYEKLYETL